jgi:hypothetical protein
VPGKYAPVFVRTDNVLEFLHHAWMAGKLSTTDLVILHEDAVVYSEE